MEITVRSPKKKTLPLAWFVIGGILLVMTIMFITTLPIRWVIITVGGISFAAIFSFFRDKKEVLFLFFLFVNPFSIAKWVFKKPYLYIGDTPDTLVVYLTDFPLTALLILWAFELGFLNKSIFRIPKICIPFIGLIIWSILSMLNAPYPAFSFFEVLKMIKLLLLGLYIANNIKTKRQIDLAMGVLLLAAFIQGGLTIASYFLKTIFTLYGSFGGDYQLVAGERLFRATGTVGPHNVQAQFFAVLMPAAFVYFLTLRSRSLRFASLFTFAVAGAGLFLTFSRGGWVGAAVALTVTMLLCLRKKIFSKPMAWTIVLLVIMGITWLFSNPENIIFQRFMRSESIAVSSRLEMLKVSWHMIKAHPILGVGINNFIEVAEHFFVLGVPKAVKIEMADKIVIIHAHHKYLHLAAEVGVMGLVFFLWMLFIYFSQGFRCLTSNDPWISSTAIGLTAAMMGIAVHMNFEAFNREIIRNVYWVFFMFMDIIYRMDQSSKVAPPVPDTSRATVPDNKSFKT